MYIVRKYQIHFYALYKTDFCFVSFSGRFRSECKLISYYPTMTEEETVMTFAKPLFLNLKIKNKFKKNQLQSSLPQNGPVPSLSYTCHITCRNLPVNHNTGFSDIHKTLNGCRLVAL